MKIELSSDEVKEAIAAYVKNAIKLDADLEIYIHSSGKADITVSNPKPKNNVVYRAMTGDDRHD